MSRNPIARLPDRLPPIARRLIDVLQQDRALWRAARRMPKPVPWDWAKDRVLPLLAGPWIDADNAGPVRAAAGHGGTIMFGLEIGGALPIIDVPVADRWECTAEQIRDVALRNLARRAASLDRSIVTQATLSGHLVRLIYRNVAWASSLLLVRDELTRLYGKHDQVFAAAGWATLMSLPVDIPGWLAGELIVDMETRLAYPLMLEPFVLAAGELVWGGRPDD